MISFPIKNFFLYLVFILPLTYVFGIAITEINVLILIIYFLYKNKDLSYFKDKKFIYLFFFSFYISINSLIQIPYNDLKVPSIFHFRYIIFSLSIFYILNLYKETKNLKNFFQIFVLSFISFIIFDALVQFLFGYNLFGYEITKNRISGIFGSELILGSFLVRILPLLLWLIFYIRFENTKHQKILYLFFTLYFFVIYISGERASIVLLFILIFLLSILLKPIRKIILISTLFMFLFIIFTSYFNIGKSDPFNRIFIKTFNQIQKNYEIDANNEIKFKTDKTIEKEYKKLKDNIVIFSLDHTGHYVLAFNLFKKNPIFGKGPEGFKSHCRDVEYITEIGICSVHPHNYLMQILAETGLVGFFIYFFGISFILIKIIQINKKKLNLRDKSCFIICSLALLINLFPFIPSGNLFNNWISIVNYYYIGLYFFNYNKIYNT